MPGHDHHLQFVYQPGDLNSPSALYNWTCPVDGDDSEDITRIFKRFFYFFYFRCYIVSFPYFTGILLLVYHLFLRTFGELGRRLNAIEFRKGFLETSVANELFGPENCSWLEMLRYERKLHL